MSGKTVNVCPECFCILVLQREEPTQLNRIVCAACGLTFDSAIRQTAGLLPRAPLVLGINEEEEK